MDFGTNYGPSTLLLASSYVAVDFAHSLAVEKLP
jgi:hypothetical protein